MIKHLKLKFGSSPGKPDFESEITPITIFVGPNNSGKSKILMEIENFCRHGALNATNVILQEITFNEIINPEVELNNYTLTPNPGEFINPGHIIFGKGRHRNQLNREGLLSILKDANGHIQQFCQLFVTFNCIRIDGSSRINLINDQGLGDLQMHPQNSLAFLFRDNAKRLEVRRIVYDAFKRYFVIDPTSLGSVRIRLSDIEPPSEIVEKGIHEEAVKFHNAAQLISQASDGVKAFTGIIIELIAGDPSIILIDEPEAFLHPSLSYKLGKEVGNAVNNGAKNLFVSTHSANFLMGCIQSGTPINIVRLTYSNSVATARILPNEKILKLMRHPLLRSVGVLNGLFYEYVIITEADSDRAFYQEINERLLLLDPARGIPNCLFLNAQNKQTIHEIIRPLREMGIPAVAIVDVDVVKEGGQPWSKLLGSANIPVGNIQALGQLRGTIKGYFDAKGGDFKKDGGVEVLDQPEAEACNNLFNQLDEYGIFTVRKGELESWLKPLGIAAAHSPEWLIQMFEKLGEDPQSAEYIKPAAGDVWDFIGKIKIYLENPNKKGIPE